MSDGRENKIKKLKMRSMRRGIKEMDVILSYYSEVCLEKMPGVKLDLYSDLLFENDQDLYSWCSGQAVPKKKYAAIISPNIVRGPGTHAYGKNPCRSRKTLMLKNFSVAA